MISTPGELRNAMNSLARTTSPLDPAAVLRSGRRRRGRRRVAAAAGAAVALLAVTGGIAALRPATGPGGNIAGSSPAIGDLDNSLEGLAAGKYAFTRTGAYLLTDIVRAEIDGAAGYVIEYRDSTAVLRAGGTLYLKPTGAGTYSDPAILDAIRREGLSQAEIDQYAVGVAQLDGEGWLRVDQRRLAEAAAVEEQSSLDGIAAGPTADEPDITGAGDLIRAVKTAKRSGDTITGTLDATKVDSALRLIIADPAGFYGPAARSMSFQAILDEQGRLARFTLDLPDRLASQEPDFQPEPSLVITVTQYDGVTAPQAPAGAEEIAEMTYELLARDND